MADWEKYQIPKISKQQYLLGNILEIRNCHFVCKDKASVAELSAQKLELKEKLFQIIFTTSGKNIITYVSFNEVKAWILGLAGINLDAIPSKYFIIALLKKTLSPFLDLLIEEYSISLTIEDIKTVSLDIEKYLFSVKLTRENSQGNKLILQYFISDKHNSWMAKSISSLPAKQNSLENYARLKASFHKWDFTIPYLELVSVQLGDIILLNKSNDSGDVKIFIEDIEFASGKYDGFKVVVDEVAKIATEQQYDTRDIPTHDVINKEHEELDDDYDDDDDDDDDEDEDDDDEEDEDEEDEDEEDEDEDEDDEDEIKEGTDESTTPENTDKQDEGG